MKYELVMLRNAIRMKNSAKILTEEMKLIALKSYSTVNWRDGTMGQIEAIGKISQQIEDCNIFYNSVKKALLIVPKGYRALLVAVYFKNVDRQELASKYKVSLSTVYRKLLYARESFLSALRSIGCSEEWFLTNYGELDFAENLPYRKRKR
ncbi:MAG: sigma-70 family RNA polymerase sigma factor [Clostridiales bacterium]|nr:sigma-70 family RNA polymerase sigma factor [Clostridiales bacterium]